MFAGSLAGGVEKRGPVAEGVERAFEAEALEGFVVADGGRLHEVADDVVGDGVHEEFAGDHVGGEAAEDFHAEEGFEFAEVEFDAPALEVEFAEGLGGVELGVEEGGCDEAVGSAEAFGDELDFYDADGEGLGCFGVFFFGDAFGELCGFGPGLEAVVGAEFFPLAEVDLAGLVESDDAVDAEFLELGNGVVGAEASVGEEDVALIKKLPQAAEEGDFVEVEIAFGEVKEGAAGQREESDEAQEREAAAGLLGGGLGVFFLVFESIWHGEGCAVNDLDMAAFPKGVLRCVGFAAVGDVAGDGGEGFLGEFGAGFAVGGGLRGRVYGGIGCGVPSQSTADDLSAGGVWGEDLGEEGPEEDGKAVDAAAAEVAFFHGGKEFVGNGIGAGGLEVAEGVGGFEFVEGFFLLGFGRAAEEQGAESGKEGRGISHGEVKRMHTHA